jgi:hypothetical protein
MAMILRITAILVTACLSATGLTQELEVVVDNSNLGAAYARLVSFEAEPEIAAARFTVDSDDPDTDDVDIRTIKLPYYREIGHRDESLRWFIQATATYLDMDQSQSLEISPGTTDILDASWEGFGAMLEGGMLLSISESLVLAPSIGIGITRLESEMDFSSKALEDLLAPAKGIIYDWDTLASVVRGSVALRYNRSFGDWRVKSSGHLSGSYVDSFDESRRFPGFSDESGNLGLKLDISHPVGFDIRDYPVFLIGHLGYTSFIGANRDELGFTEFGEAGVSFGVQKFTLGLLGIVGSDVSGWNLQLNYDY